MKPATSFAPLSLYKMKLKKLIHSLIALLFCLILIEQPLLTQPAFAAITPASSQDNANQIVAAETADTSVNNILNDWDELSWVTDAVTPSAPAATTGTSATDATAPKVPARLQGVLDLSPTDQVQLNNCIDPAKTADCKVDVRLTDYLLNLISPIETGGGGFTNISARIFQGYNTTGIGKYDRQTLDANLEDPTLVSPHNSGSAVDITAAGEVTCKLVEHRLIGGHTTHWQSPQTIKVAWQSPTGITNNPVPTGDSLIGTAGTMTASGIVNYLNSTGQMDAYVDYVKGLSFGQMAEYVGGNILLKNLNSLQVQFDPLGGSVISAIGTSALLKQLPGLPSGINGGSGNEDVRIAAAKAQIEDGLGLPTGSLTSYGWNDLLTNTGKRQLEQALSLPTHYLDSHDVKSLTTSDVTKAVFSYVARSDDALNFIPGTVAALQKGDTNGLKMAGVNILAKAFKLSSDQTSKITTAISKNQAPSLDIIGLNTGNQLSLDALTGYLSTNPAEQKKAQNELKNIGLALFQKAASSATPSRFNGLTSSLISQLLNPSATVKQNDLTNQVGAVSLMTASDVDPSLATEFILNPKSNRSVQTANLMAIGLNELLSLNGSTSLSASDITNLLGSNYDSLKKIGGSQIDRAFHWQSGTGLGVINDPSKLEEAMKQTFANNIGSLLGIDGNLFGLGKNPTQDYGLSLIAQRFGLGGFTGNTSAATLLAQIGNRQFNDLFGLTNLSPTNWDDPTLNALWSTDDINLGVVAGTTKAYLKGELDGSSFAKAVGDSNVTAIDPTQLFNQFGLLGDFAIDGGDKGAQKNDIKLLTDYLKNGTGATQALGLIQKIVGRSVDVKANFAVDDFTKFFAAKTNQERTTILLDTGLKLFGRSLGANSPNYTDAQIDGLMTQLKGIFNQGDGIFSPHNPLFNQAVLPLTNFFLAATGIPQQYTQDANNFLHGDYKTGLSDLSFILWQKNINPYLPAADQLSYDEFRNTLGISDDTAIQKKADELAPKVDEAGNPISVRPTAADLDVARQELNKEASQNVQYKMSDAFLRKIDPTIPVGFTKAMFTGSGKDRAESLQSYAFSNLDTILKKINPAYAPGTLEKLYTGAIDPSRAVLSLLGTKDSSAALSAAIAKSGLTLGPLNSTDLGGLISYFALPKANQNLLTDTQYAGTWGNLDKWLSNSVGIGALPPGIAKSLVYAGQNNWNFDANLKNAAGQTVIASVNSLATDFATAKLTGWADKELHMPAGSVYQIYTATKSVITASALLAEARHAQDAAKILSSSKALSQAQASLTVLAITTALQVCAACQAFFSSVDAAIHAPPGFTNAAVAGAIAAAFHLGYMGLYVAAAIYLFGVNSTSYECPTPPVDQYAITSFDQGADQLSTGYTPGTDGPAPPSPNPAPGQNPFDWDDTVPFGAASNATWEGWARYFTGALIDASLNYAAGQDDFNKPLQVLTYRQANAEFFAPRSPDAFGPAEAGNDKVGLGFTQNSTKTTDYVYVAFGGYF